MGFPIKQHIIGAIILLSVVTGCIQGVTDKEEAPVSTIQTEISSTEVVESQQPAVSHTPIPTVIVGQSVQVYRTMLIIQANAEQLKEADKLVEAEAVEMRLIESPMMSQSVSIVSINDLISNIHAPTSISLPWKRAHFVHQGTEAVLESWLQGEMSASQAVGELTPVIEDIRQDVSEVEEALVSEYGYDRGEIDQERLMVLEVMQRMRGEGEKLEKMIMQVIHYEGKEFEICFTSECL